MPYSSSPFGRPRYPGEQQQISPIGGTPLATLRDKAQLHPGFNFFDLWSDKYFPGYMQSTAPAEFGMGTLFDILKSQGKTDPRLMNQNIAAIDRGTSQQQGALQGFLANAGLQGSGVGQALGASIGQAGQQRQSNLRANEAQLQEQRKREDLNLLMQMLINPQMDWAALGTGQYNADRARGDQNSANKAAAIAGLMGTLAAAFCWAAEEFFGGSHDAMDACRVAIARRPLLAVAYLNSGKNLAYSIKHDPGVRDLVRPGFEALVLDGEN